MKITNAIVLVMATSALCGCGPAATMSSPVAASPVRAPETQAATSGGWTISGSVLDTGYRGLAGARVEVLDGPDAGLSATTGVDGQFALTGRFDRSTKFRASQAGHATQTMTWNCSVAVCDDYPAPRAARPWLLFFLDVPVPPVDIAGAYYLTFTADTSCTDLPDELRSRTYAARIERGRMSRFNPIDTTFLVTIEDVPVLGTFREFEIGVAGRYLGFFLHGGHDPPVVEQLASTTFLAYSGSGSATVGAGPASTISAQFEGWIEYCVMQTSMGPYYNCGTNNSGEPIPGASITRSHCDSKNHRLTLTRR